MEGPGEEESEAKLQEGVRMEEERREEGGGGQDELGKRGGKTILTVPSSFCLGISKTTTSRSAPLTSTS